MFLSLKVLVAYPAVGIVAVALGIIPEIQTEMHARALGFDTSKKLEFLPLEERAMPAAKPEALINNKFVNAVINVESGWDPNAVSRCGARGLMQIMEPTWKDMTDRPWEEAFNPTTNRDVGTKYLHWIEKYIQKNGGIPTRNLIAAAYNGGVGRLKKFGWDISKMPTETRQYIHKVNAAYDK